MAEREGFEPPIRCRIPDFESGAFDHSAISPGPDYTARSARTSEFRRFRLVPGLVFRFILLAAFAALLGGCASTPPGAGVPKIASTALQTPASTRVGSRTAALESAHPGLSAFRLLSRGLDSFVARAELAAAAEKTLDVQYYIVQNDDTGQLLLETLLLAADRGVRVRLLIDDTGTSGRQEPLMTLAAHPQIELRVFNPFTTRGSMALRAVEFVFGAERLNYRMHNKLFICDNAVAITGGRNIGDEYFSASRRLEFGDYDLLIAGPATRTLSRSFDAYWNSDQAVPAEALGFSKPSPQDLEAYRKSLAEHHQAMAGTDFVKGLQQGGPLRELLANQRVTWAHSEVLYDSPDKASVEAGEVDGKLMRQRVEQAMKDVRSELLMVSPYLVPGDDGLRLLRGLRERNVTLRILTNSLASSDAPIVQAGYDRYRIPLLEIGAELFEVRPVLGQPESRGGSVAKSGGGQFALHAKVMIFDRQRVFVGSMNFDQRSLKINTEIGLLIDSRDMAETLARRFADSSQPANAFALSLTPPDASGHQALVWSTVENGQPVTYDSEPGASFLRRLQADAFALFPIEDQL